MYCFTMYHRGHWFPSRSSDVPSRSCTSRRSALVTSCKGTNARKNCGGGGGGGSVCRGGNGEVHRRVAREADHEKGESARDGKGGGGLYRDCGY